MPPTCARRRPRASNRPVGSLRLVFLPHTPHYYGLFAAKHIPQATSDPCRNARSGTRPGAPALACTGMRVHLHWRAPALACTCTGVRKRASCRTGTRPKAGTTPTTGADVRCGARRLHTRHPAVHGRRRPCLASLGPHTRSCRPRETRKNAETFAAPARAGKNLRETWRELSRATAPSTRADLCARGTDPCARGTDSCARGTDPCARGTDPCARGTDPCARGSAEPALRIGRPTRTCGAPLAQCNCHPCRRFRRPYVSHLWTTCSQGPSASVVLCDWCLLFCLKRLIIIHGPATSEIDIRACLRKKNTTRQAGIECVS